MFCGYMYSVSREKRQRSVAMTEHVRSAAVCKPTAKMHDVVTVHLLKVPQFIFGGTCIFALLHQRSALQPIDPPFSCDSPTAAPLSSPPHLQPFPLVQQLLQPSLCFLYLRPLHLHDNSDAWSVPTISSPGLDSTPAGRGPSPANSAPRRIAASASGPVAAWPTAAPSGGGEALSSRGASAAPLHT